MNAKIMAMMMVGVMMFSGCVVMMDAGENDAVPTGEFLYGMGSNAFYQQGDGSTASVLTPTQIGGSLGQITSVENSAYTTFFITADGKLYGMGRNNNYQFGDGTKDSVTTPTQIGSFTNVSDVASSYQNTFFIDSGKLYGMGRNNYGQQGNSSTADVSTPTQIGSFANVTSVVCSAYTTFFIDSGKLYGMGLNNESQQGDGTTSNVLTPTQIGSFANVTSVVCSDYTTFFIDSGKLYGMGDGSRGQQGNSSTADVSTPTQIGSFNNVQYVACSNITTFFIDSGKLYGMGAGTQLGIGVATDVTTPTQIGSFTNVTSVVCNISTSFFIDSGKLYGAGKNDRHQQGNGTTTDVNTFTQIGSYDNVSYVNCSSVTTFFIDSGKLYGMGYNSDGQMGTGNQIEVYTPTQIGASLGGIALVSCTDSITFVLTAVSAYTVTIETNGGYGATNVNSIPDVPPSSVITISSNTLTIDQTTVTATPLTDTAQYDYSFTGWYDGSTQLVGGETVTGDMTITAHFARSLNDYTVTASASSYGSVSPASVTQPYGSAISASGNVLTIGSQTITATPDAADAQYTYTFTGWSTFPSTLTENTSVTANFDRTVNTYIITWSVSGSTTSETLSYGAMPEHEDPVPPEGYLFAGWNPEIAAVTGDQTYTAVFEEIVYITVTFDPNGGQLEGSTTKTVGIGTPYGEFPTPHKDNNKFLGWYTDLEEGTLVTADTIVPEDAGTTLYAHWELTGFAAMLKPLLFLFPLILLAFLAIALVRTFA